MPILLHLTIPTNSQSMATYLPGSNFLLSFLDNGNGLGVFGICDTFMV